MTNLRNTFLFCAIFAAAAALVGWLGLGLGADCMVIGLIALLTAAALLASIMLSGPGGPGAPPHTLR